VGAQGVKGDTGAAGVCDTSSCTQVTSINGLSGGTVNGQVTLSSVEISAGTGTPSGVIIESNGSKTSVGGFFCNAYNHVTGDMVSDQGSSTLSPVRRAKSFCEGVCSNHAAHPCLTTELLVAQELYGGIGTVANGSVPMPPTNVEGWVLSPDPSNSCDDFNGTGPAGADPSQGTTFKLGNDEGGFLRENCDQSLPLFCCL
jgi:hypothetical protein